MNSNMRKMYTELEVAEIVKKNSTKLCKITLTDGNDSQLIFISSVKVEKEGITLAEWKELSKHIIIPFVVLDNDLGTTDVATGVDSNNGNVSQLVNTEFVPAPYSDEYLFAVYVEEL